MYFGKGYKTGLPSFPTSPYTHNRTASARISQDPKITGVNIGIYQYTLNLCSNVFTGWGTRLSW